MQVLYGIKITDRVTVEPCLPKGFMAFFDGELIGTEDTPGAAVKLAVRWLKARAEQREWEKKWDAEREEQMQAETDDIFLVYIAEKLGISDGDMDRLIEVIGRKLK